MNKVLNFAAGAVLVAGGLPGCSSPSPAPPRPDVLPRGTVQVTVDGKDIGSASAVTCTTTTSLKVITTGDSTAGTTSMLDNTDTLTVKGVNIHNIGGFSGSYWQGLDGEAQIHMSGSTYLIGGTAAGFSTDNPIDRTTERFTIKVAC